MNCVDGTSLKKERNDINRLEVRQCMTPSMTLGYESYADQEEKRPKTHDPFTIHNSRPTIHHSIVIFRKNQRHVYSQTFQPLPMDRREP